MMNNPFKRTASKVAQSLADAENAAATANSVASKASKLIEEVGPDIAEGAKRFKRAGRLAVVGTGLATGAAGLGLINSVISLNKNIKEDKKMSNYTFQYMGTADFGPGKKIKEGLETAGRLVKKGAIKAVAAERAAAKMVNRRIDNLVESALDTSKSIPKASPSSSSVRAVKADVVSDPDVLNAIERKLKSSGQRSNIETEVRKAAVENAKRSSNSSALEYVPTNEDFVKQPKKKGRKRLLAAGGAAALAGGGALAAIKAKRERNKEISMSIQKMYKYF